MKHRALYTGSFDPMTNGHLDIITRSSRMFDELVVGVIVNPSKKALFTKEERVRMIQDVVKDLRNVTVDSFEGLLADYVNAGNFDAVVRGLRATTDFEYEIQMAQMNARLFDKGIESVFLMTSPEYSFISSSMIKEVISLGGCADGLVPETIMENIKSKYR
ncbi:pantetheine-phosphate adenylyltransferase [Eubacterium sp. AB3007]|uniref:pantetheine-phosphate adenylyltransferase n=1 Tax=Eubacterium sp. AB3007 TaxID=1392487 RepID=UPI0004895A77|nr:pantetheine-phosphate adenylyltransferase [Eubacterium sp. AB3007]